MEVQTNKVPRAGNKDSDAGVSWTSRWWNRNDSEQTGNINPTNGDTQPKEVIASSSGSYGEANYESWYNSAWNMLPTWRQQSRQALSLQDDVSYTDLNEEQLELIKTEIFQSLAVNASTWCWYKEIYFNDAGKIQQITRKEIIDRCTSIGMISVVGTASIKCPIPLDMYPLYSPENEIQISIHNSLILPSQTPLHTFHTQPLSTKIASTVKDHYNYENETHLYLKKNVGSDLKDKNILIVTCVGNLPKEYEKYSIEQQPSSLELTEKLCESILLKHPKKIKTLSIQSPLNCKELDKALEEMQIILENWVEHFANADVIFFSGIYHSTPLLILIINYVLYNHSTFKVKKNIPIGVLLFESCMEGYRFWDHNSDPLSSGDDTDDYNKILQMKEKQLYQGVSKQERDTLMKLRNYRKRDSEESLLVKNALSKILNQYPTLRLTFFGKLYDNFMTISQKLGVDFKHPQIFRHVWCDAKYMGVDLKDPVESGISDAPIDDKSLNFNCILPIPKNRLLEITLINTFLLALNLGHYEFIAIIKLLSPFFISRGFNSNTIPPTLQKQIQNQLKLWIQDMDTTWKKTERTQSKQIDGFPIPDDVTSFDSFVQYIHYKSLIDKTYTSNNNSAFKGSEIDPESAKLVLNSDMYTDNMVYQCFIENTLTTKSPLNRKSLVIIDDHSAPKSILNETNQYDLVWRFHEALSSYLTISNLPHQEFPLHLNFELSKNYTNWQDNKIDPSKFVNGNSEAITRVKQIWECYATWDPPTRGLKQLRKILSILEFYEDSEQLIEDIQIPKSSLLNRQWSH